MNKYITKATIETHPEATVSSSTCGTHTQQRAPNDTDKQSNQSDIINGGVEPVSERSTLP